jgi:hypothetical protein
MLCLVSLLLLLLLTGTEVLLAGSVQHHRTTSVSVAWFNSKQLRRLWGCY